MTKKADVSLMPTDIWSTIQASHTHTVVQIVAHVAQFDWCQPYRIEDQYESFGSGFLIDEKGLVVTNAHVIENAKYIWIQVPILGRKKLDVAVVGICPDRDIALLKISDDGLHILREALGKIPFLLLGDSDAVASAESVLVLGYPLGQYHVKSTTGIVSGKEVMLSNLLLQITAPINPGSSGGPILNGQGHVVGIAVAIILDAQNVGYAIPINELRIIMPDLLSKKIVRKPYLGARFVDAGDEKARFLNNPLPAGLYIAQVFPHTVCALAGIQAGDMLYEFNGFILDAYGEAQAPWSLDKVSLHDLISRVVVGDEIKMVIYRSGERKEITCIMKEVVPFAIRTKFPDYEDVSYETIAGLVIMELTENHIMKLLENCPELIRFRQLENRINSVLIITHIVPGSYAYQMEELEVGTIVIALNGEQVSTLEDWRNALIKSATSGFVVLLTEHNVLTVFSLKTIIADDKKLTDAFNYPLSEAFKNIQKNIM